MITDEIKVRTRKELEVLFNKLVKEDFIWASEEYLLGRGLNIITKYPAYIHLHDNKKVTWGDRAVEKRLWNILEL